MSGFLLELLPWSLSGTTREQKLYVVTLSLLLAGSLLALLARTARTARRPRRRGRRRGVVGWLLSTRPGEGATLLVVLPCNGLTVADLAAVPAVLLVVVLAARRLSRA